MVEQKAALWVVDLAAERVVMLVSSTAARTDAQTVGQMAALLAAPMVVLMAVQ